ncbi:endonuclease I [Pseudomonas sp. BE134]|nr:endonuclease I [Pseudomonas sp. BE134]
MSTLTRFSLKNTDKNLHKSLFILFFIHKSSPCQRTAVPYNEVNGDRNNFSFGWLPVQTGQYGSCLTQVDFKAKKVMPRPSIRGMIARTYFYMSKQYGLSLSKQDRQLYEAWNKTYPVEAWERQRNQSVACVMGRGNEFVGPVNMKACS